jgi:hypothetical protein
MIRAIILAVLLASACSRPIATPKLIPPVHNKTTPAPAPHQFILDWAEMLHYS